MKATVCGPLGATVGAEHRCKIVEANTDTHRYRHASAHVVALAQQSCSPSVHRLFSPQKRLARPPNAVPLWLVVGRHPDAPCRVSSHCLSAQRMVPYQRLADDPEHTGPEGAPMRSSRYRIMVAWEALIAGVFVARCFSMHQRQRTLETLWEDRIDFASSECSYFGCMTPRYTSRADIALTCFDRRANVAYLARTPANTTHLSDSHSASTSDRRLLTASFRTHGDIPGPASQSAPAWNTTFGHSSCHARPSQPNPTCSARQPGRPLPPPPRFGLYSLGSSILGPSNFQHS